MRRLSLLFSLLATTSFAEVPRVATDIAPVHGLVAAVMDGVGTPDLIIPPGASPHGYAMRPSEARNLAAADLVIWVGPGLTPWLADPLESLAGDAVHFSLMDVEGTRTLPVREGVGFEDHDHDHGEHDDHDDHAEHDEHDEHDDHAEHGEHDDHGDEAGEDDHEDHSNHDDHQDHDDHADHDDHNDHDQHHAGSSDPHAWLDPLNGAVWAAAISNQLSEWDPENAATYKGNALSVILKLLKFEADKQIAFAPLKDRPFVVLHDAFQYVEARFDLNAVAAVHDTDAASPGAARVAQLRDHVQSQGVVCAFAEPQLNQGLLITVTEGLPVKIGTLDPLGADVPLGPSHYLDTLDQLAQDMRNCLGE